MTHFKKTLLSLFISGVALSSLCLSSPTSADVLNYFPPNQKDFPDTKGTHLIINITALNEDGTVAVTPAVMVFPLTPGQCLTKHELITMIQNTIDQTLPNKFQVTELEYSASIQMNMTGYTQEYPVTEYGFSIPNLTRSIKDPGFLFTGNVIVKPREMYWGNDYDNTMFETKPTTSISYDSDKVFFEHGVTFIKREGGNLVSTPIHFIDYNEKEIGYSFSSEELFNKAKDYFMKTEEYREGYRLIKRLNGSVIEDSYHNRSIWDIDTGGEFNYTISSNRQPSREHTESLKEQYYISKNGDDYELKPVKATINFVDENNHVIYNHQFHSYGHPSTQDIQELINGTEELKKKTGKNGLNYAFTGEVTFSDTNTFYAKVATPSQKPLLRPYYSTEMTSIRPWSLPISYAPLQSNVVNHIRPEVVEMGYSFVDFDFSTNSHPTLNRYSSERQVTTYSNHKTFPNRYGYQNYQKPYWFYYLNP